jgi:hypothetical protein
MVEAEEDRIVQHHAGAIAGAIENALGLTPP